MAGPLLIHIRHNRAQIRSHHLQPAQLSHFLDDFKACVLVEISYDPQALRTRTIDKAFFREPILSMSFL
ncbi:hypothetical protein Hypma_002965 [Hypsizygus marmoreus]|uniref:Uncharacterized protein n=1 Tax=Hypsizygus marmoreus TaxID=39966 RepID=A0A369JC16_HYPMA|nr:hypothetical protein Hypma_002965 [Hypsizygus marmoreus]